MKGRLMDFNTIKIYLFSAFSLTITISNINAVASLILMIVTIGYTIHKWIKLTKK